MPDDQMIKTWLNIVDDFFVGTIQDNSQSKIDTPQKNSSKQSKPHPRRMAVHCVAGLGRAPLLVALALIHRGCEPINAIELIRSKRTGALNMI